MREHSVTLPQGTLHVREHGPAEGEPVVFVHGYLMAGDLWDPVAGRLAADGLRCIAPTWPLGAHRTPMAPEADLGLLGLAALIAGLFEAMDLRDVTLVGNDSGGALTQLVAVHDPERVGRIVLTPCDAFDNLPPKIFKPLVWMAKAGLLRLAVAPMRFKAFWRLPMTYGSLAHTRIPDEQIARWLAPSRRDRAIFRDVRKVTAGLDGKVLRDATPGLAGFDRPALVMFATDDAMFPLGHGRRLAELLPQGRFEPIADSRTFVMIDQPERTAALIHDFVRGTAAGQAAAGSGSSSDGIAPAGMSPGKTG